jgi:hypothetical protein
VQRHATSRQEIENLRELINRDLKDAGIEGLSNDRRFATAYNAVLQLSKMAIACAGYRVAVGVGHHQKTFEAVKIAIGTTSIEALADYFETCRRKRNNIDYDAAEIVTETEADEILKKAREFQILIEDWIAKHHPSYES